MVMPWVWLRSYDPWQRSEGRAVKLGILYSPHYNYVGMIADSLWSFLLQDGLEVRFLSIDDDFGTQDLEYFDGLLIHFATKYQLFAEACSPKTARAVEEFRGFKGLWLQDEGDWPSKAEELAQRLGVSRLYTCVDSSDLPNVYPRLHQSGVTFRRVLTGYWPLISPKPISFQSFAMRPVDLAYRGREWPIFHGYYGYLRSFVPQLIESRAPSHLTIDISTTEGHRLYGREWRRWLQSSRAQLTLESGYDIIDPKGVLRSRRDFVDATYPDVAEEINLYRVPDALVRISPRSFEATAAGNALVAVRGHYEGILTESNCVMFDPTPHGVEEVLDVLRDARFLFTKQEAAYQEFASRPDLQWGAFTQAVADDLDDWLSSAGQDRPQRMSTSPPICHIEPRQYLLSVPGHKVDPSLKLRLTRMALKTSITMYRTAKRMLSQFTKFAVAALRVTTRALSVSLRWCQLPVKRSQRWFLRRLARLRQQSLTRDGYPDEYTQYVRAKASVRGGAVPR